MMFAFLASLQKSWLIEIILDPRRGSIIVGKLENTKSDIIESAQTHSDTSAKIRMETRDLNAYFSRVHALKNISLSVPKNKVLAIIGPSGCGKSTFLRCLNRMHEEVGGTIKGSVLIDGESVMEHDPVWLRKKVGMIFQKPNPFPTMSIADNVTAGLRLNGFHNRKKLNEIVEKSLKQAALWDEVKDILDLRDRPCQAVSSSVSASPERLRLNLRLYLLMNRPVRLTPSLPQK